MPQSLTVSDVLYLAVISGALGGLVYVCTKINIRRNLVMFDVRGAKVVAVRGSGLWRG